MTHPLQSTVEKEEALWRKQVRDLKGKVEGTKAYKAMSDAKIAIEDSDNPLVQRSKSDWERESGNVGKGKEREWERVIDSILIDHFYYRFGCGGQYFY